MRVSGLHLTPDQAVPLSLLLTEALTNAIKYAGFDRDSAATVPRLTISLKRQGGVRAVMIVCNSVPTDAQTLPPQPLQDGSGLGTQLIGAFATQLAAEIQTEVVAGMYQLTVTFDVTPLDRAETESGARAEVAA